MPTVSIRYWAGARAAAGMDAEVIQAETVATALRIARDRHADPRFDRVLEASSLLLDGVALHPADLEAQLVQDARVEVLPPFAGG
ncbi:hypothetical protein GCM10009841_36780 [Microlunatus panaciterrae]|uniref:Molybdopterin converting factor small subunit n=1 Tax=Microlunatus panaciterrae TaxID=400768 RepID=A0ABS2RH54_9ACTN|nr:MoaD/ThiS family protein [Microlunatus panaciterrae]MBM7798339.1 molybdopterin converting factor small subunit [Microlunatus panaciterrae]